MANPDLVTCMVAILEVFPPVTMPCRRTPGLEEGSPFRLPFFENLCRNGDKIGIQRKRIHLLALASEELSSLCETSLFD